MEDLDLLREDEGLKKLGLRVPSPEAARWFLRAFHDEKLLSGRLPGKAFIPEETAELKGLREVQKDLIRKATRKEGPWKATIDLDAVIIQSHKEEAFFTYLGHKGYQL